MTLIGMAEAAKRAGVATGSIRRALRNAGVQLVQISANAYAVDEADLARFLAERGELRVGRPRKAEEPPAAA